MFEQAFKNIDDVLWKDAGCTSELDYTEQTSWLLFLKYLDALEQDKASEAALNGKKYTHILDKPYRWETWAAPKGKDGKIDHNQTLTGDDLIQFVNGKLFPYLHGFKQKATGPNTIEYKIGEIFGEIIKNTFLSNTDNASVSLRKLLLESCNLHTVLDCPGGTFIGAGVKTVVLFFEKGAPTRKVWFYQLAPGRNMGKTHPLNDSDLAEFVELQNTKADSPKSWSVDVASIDPSTLDLSTKNPNGGEEITHRSPQLIMDGSQGTWYPPWYGPIGVSSVPGRVVSNSIPKAISFAFIVVFLCGLRCVLRRNLCIAMTHMSHVLSGTSSRWPHVFSVILHVS